VDFQLNEYGGEFGYLVDTNMVVNSAVGAGRGVYNSTIDENGPITSVIAILFHTLKYTQIRIYMQINNSLSMFGLHNSTSVI